VLDDLHWATTPTLAMLGHLACSGEPGSLLVIGTYRDTQLDITPELADTLADLLRQPDVARVRLGGLDAHGVASYLEAQARHELDAEDRELAAVLHAETNGNPFFVNQMLRHLIETGTLRRRDGKWSAGPAAHVEVPDSVRDVIARRLARLPDETREILTLAAVQGDRFDLRVIVEAAGQPQIAVLRALDPAISARLVTEADGFSSSRRFVHALVRHTIYDGLPAAERLELHRATGTALATVAGEAWSEHAGELAGHWLAAVQVGATPDEARRTLNYAQEAARRSTASLAYEDAVTQLARALPLVEFIADQSEKAGTHIELLIALGEAQRRAGDTAHRETLLEATRRSAERGDADALARAALANTRGTLPSIVGDVDYERVAAFEAALEAIGADDTPTRARLLAALAAEITYTGDRGRRLRLADEALAIARRCRDATTLALVLLHRWYAIYFPDTLDELLANTEELLALTERFDDPVIRAQALWLRGRILARAGEMEEANRRFEAAERLAEELGQPTLRWLVGTTATGRTILAGDLEEGERRAHAAFELGRASGQQDAPSFLAGHLFLVRLEQDRLAELEESFTERVAALSGFPTIRAYLARILCELDRPDEAVKHYELLSAENFNTLPRDVTWLLGMSHCAAVAASVGDRAGARVLFDLLAPYASQIVFANAGAPGAVAHYLAILAATFGDFDEAGSRFAEAAGIHERIGAPTWLARTRVEWARMLLTRAKPGDTERAHELLHQALATARDRGLANIERRAGELLSPP
jgi:tetratricopeptide (TPR) repeat protein